MRRQIEINTKNEQLKAATRLFADNRKIPSAILKKSYPRSTNISPVTTGAAQNLAQASASCRRF